MKNLDLASAIKIASETGAISGSHMAPGEKWAGGDLLVADYDYLMELFGAVTTEMRAAYHEGARAQEIGAQ